MAQEKQQYLFYCTICGTPFKPTMPHARTCSNHCRAVLHGFNKRGLPEIPAEEKTPIDKEAVAEQYKTSSGGKEMPKGILAQYPDKTKERKESITDNLLGKKENKETPAAKEPSVPVPATDGKKEDKKTTKKK